MIANLAIALALFMGYPPEEVPTPAPVEAPAPAPAPAPPAVTYEDGSDSAGGCVPGELCDDTQRVVLCENDHAQAPQPGSCPEGWRTVATYVDLPEGLTP